jgi:hypothetical protein
MISKARLKERLLLYNHGSRVRLPLAAVVFPHEEVEFQEL